MSYYVFYVLRYMLWCLIMCFTFWVTCCVVLLCVLRSELHVVLSYYVYYVLSYMLWCPIMCTTFWVTCCDVLLCVLSSELHVVTSYYMYYILSYMLWCPLPFPHKNEKWCLTHIVLCFCFVFLRLVYPMLDCPIVIVPSMFSSVYV